MKYRTLTRTLILLVGILIPQVILCGPSLVGSKVLLPLDLLALPGWYLPVKAGEAAVRPYNTVLSDLVLQVEPTRRYVVSEVRAGRLPLWSPENFCGAPLLAANQPAVFSPYRLLDYAWDSPAAIAWGQVLKALVAGTGAYFFFRGAMRAGFAAAVIGAWCWPLCGFLTLWGGSPASAAATWLPWVLLATDGVVRRPVSARGIYLALATGAVLVSGHSGVAAHVLLCSGLYFVGRLVLACGWGGLVSKRAFVTVVTAVAGWGLGIMLAAPQVLPTLDYISRGYRVTARLGGFVETKPIGWSAFPQLLLPYFHDDSRLGHIYVAAGNRLESAAAGYAGLSMALVWAPLAWHARRRRGYLLLWLALGVIGVGQVFDLPVISTLLAHRPLNTLRNNRLVLMTGFATTAAGVAGLDLLRHYRLPRRRRLEWRAWFYLPLAACLVLGGWCVERAVYPPAEFTAAINQATDAIKAGGTSVQIRSLEDVATIARNFEFAQYGGALTCLVAAGIWLSLRHRTASRGPWFVWGAGGLVVAELTVAAYGIYPQCDPALYYPPIPTLTELAKAPAGRVIGFGCLPATLNLTHGLADIRGYDASDPARLVELLELCRQPNSPPPASYAMTQWFEPVLTSPLLDLLDVRYAILRGTPPGGAQAKYVSPDYWVIDNPTALARAFVPARAEAANDKVARLARLKDPAFDPRKVVYVESADPLPGGACDGDAAITTETPGEVTIDLDMRTPGVVVLADLYEPGWRATYNGNDVRVCPADHAVRGVVVPAGKGRLVFRYQPASFTWGVRAFLAATVALLVWTAILFRAAAHSSCLPSPRAKMLAT